MKKDISLCIMTRELCHELYRGWENDSAIYMDMDLFTPYQYNEKAVNRYFDSKQNPSRILFAIIKADKPIGELQLKQIDYECKECTLTRIIHEHIKMFRTAKPYSSFPEINRVILKNG